MSSLSVDIPEVFSPLFEPKRYKVTYGGRGGAKSWSIARILLIMAVQRPVRVLCARELQKSIKDSVHQLLTDQINDMGLSAHFEILTTEIRGKNGSRFNFCGLRHNAHEIKSYEGVDICWVEEAQAVSKTSWAVLIPTIRKDSSEIWVSFNPDQEDDETYQRFVISPPKESIVLKVGWQDNPWFPDVLAMERDELKEKDVDSYLHVWEGQCREILEGAIYAEELRKAKEEGRICNVPVDMAVPVDVFYDLGWADCTSIWFVQTVGKEIRIVDFYQNQLKPIQHYVQMLQNKGYIYRTDFLPHDARAKELGTGKSVEEVLRGLNRNVQIVPKLSIEDGIDAARALFNSCWFDAGRCADGLAALRKYRYDVDPDNGKWSKTPLHDENSHGADAFRYLAVGYMQPTQQKRPNMAGVFRR